MFILSLLSIIILVLLVFSLTKDTGKNTKYARHNAVAMSNRLAHEKNHNLTTIKVV
jgi:hypothetical protein